MQRRTLALLLPLLPLAAAAEPDPRQRASAEAAGAVAPLDGFERLAVLEVGPAPHQIGFAPGGATAAVAVAGADELVLVDAAARSVTGRMPAAGMPLAAAWVGADGALLTSAFAAGGVRRLGPDGAVERAWKTAPGASFAVGPLPDGTYLVAVESTDELLVLHPDRDGVLARYSTGARPFPPAVTSDGRLAFVPAHDDGTVTVVDLWNGAVVATTPVGARPSGAAVLPGDVDCAVALRGEDALVLVNTASFDVVGRVAGVGAGPFSVAVAPGGRLAFVSAVDGDRVAVVALPERRVLGHVPAGALPIALAVHPTGESLWVACEGAGTVEVLRVPEALRAPPAPPDDPGAVTEVCVLGTIHGGHLESERWGLSELRNAIVAFAPDAVLAEIPPNRWDRVARDWRERRVVEDERALRFPEYVDVLLPLWEELGCAIEPCAAWTAEMAALRRARLAAFEARPEWPAYREAVAAVEELLASDPIDEDDPRVIHSARYDQRARTELAPYDRFLNDWIGPGGWSNVNAAHLDLIEAALDRHRGERVLITFGAGHKHRILAALRGRDDVRLVDAAAFLPDPVAEAPLEERVRSEVCELHRFFQRWIRGELEDSASAFARFADVLAPGFEITDPDGITTAREPLLEDVRAAHGRVADPPIRVWVEHVAVERLAADRYRVTYEEWQDVDGRVRGRASTGVLVEAVNTPHGLAWTEVREAWLPE